MQKYRWIATDDRDSGVKMGGEFHELHCNFVADNEIT